MIKLKTPFGFAYFKPDAITAVSSRYEPSEKYPMATRAVTVVAAKNPFYISDTLENMRQLVGEDYQPDAPAAPKKAKRRKVSPSLQESSTE